MRRLRSTTGLVALLLLVIVALAMVVMGRAEPARSSKQPDNVIPLTVRTPHAGFNRLVVSITVCEPGTSHCATIDDVMVDTGSTGLRLEASAVPAWLSLPAHLGPDQQPLAECLHFLHDDAWGPLYRADLRLGGMVAADLPIQIISDDQRPQSAACPRSDVKPTSNGTLGIGPQHDDCPGACEQNPTAPLYFVEHLGAWQPVAGRLDRLYRLPNPVSRFPEHNNGVVFDLPLPPKEGAKQVTGTLTFGVDQLGAASIVPLDSAGQFTTLYRGRAYPSSYIDSGTETYVVDDPTIPRCPGRNWAFCSVPRVSREATVVGRAGAAVPFSIRIDDYDAILARGNGASDALAVAADPDAAAFVWGAPFFLGRRVAVVLSGAKIPGSAETAGPLYAISDQSALPRQVQH